MWLASRALKARVVLPTAAATLRVDASVCVWPHVAAFGAAGLLDIVVKHDVDINVYSTPLVQVSTARAWLVLLQCCAKSLANYKSLLPMCTNLRDKLSC